MTYRFNSRFDTLTVVLKPGSMTFVGGRVIKDPSLRAHFEQGMFETESEEIAGLLREAMKRSKDQDIVEITESDVLAFERGVKKLNVRTPMTAAETSKGLNQAGMRIQEPESVDIACPICDEVFKSQKGYNLHLVSHRPSVQITTEAPLAPAEQAKPVKATKAKAEGKSDL